jgi:hypothetical protein
MSQVGAIATNFHEGSRSEYLAQYIFSGFGTSVPIPHQEDAGFDIYATLTEERGRRSWPLFHYTVQVKSTSDAWMLRSTDSVRWLIRHPQPLYLCVLDKARTRFSVYHTFPRFSVWSSGIERDQLILEPGPVSGEWQTAEWLDDVENFSLGSPIIDYSIAELSDSETSAQAKLILKSWLEFETANLTRIRMGVPVPSAPFRYVTNQPANISGGSTSTWRAVSPDPAALRQSFRDLLPWLAYHFERQNDVAGMARVAVLLEYLRRSLDTGISPPVSSYMAINEALGLSNQLLERGTRQLSEAIDAQLPVIRSERKTAETD